MLLGALVPWMEPGSAKAYALVRARDKPMGGQTALPWTAPAGRGRREVPEHKASPGDPPGPRPRFPASAPVWQTGLLLLKDAWRF